MFSTNVTDGLGIVSEIDEITTDDVPDATVSIPGMIQMFGNGVDLYRLHGSGAVRHLAALQQFGTP